MSDSDDVWASSDDDLAQYDRTIAEKEWEKLNINHGNVTSLDSVLDHKTQCTKCSPFNRKATRKAS